MSDNEQPKPEVKVKPFTEAEVALRRLCELADAEGGGRGDEMSVHLQKLKTFFEKTAPPASLDRDKMYGFYIQIGARSVPEGGPGPEGLRGMRFPMVQGSCIATVDQIQPLLMELVGKAMGLGDKADAGELNEPPGGRTPGGIIKPNGPNMSGGMGGGILPPGHVLPRSIRPRGGGH